MITIQETGNQLLIVFSGSELGGRTVKFMAYPTTPGMWAARGQIDGQDGDDGGGDGTDPTPDPGGGTNPGGFIRPIAGNPPISDSYQAHVNRGSVNPGTDYAVGKGTSVIAPANGVVKVADTNPGGSGGRVIVIYFDGGWSGDFLHLSSLNVSVGQTVTQGQLIAKSGASGNGSENYYGAHLHFSLRNRQSTSLNGAGNVDPEKNYG